MKKILFVTIGISGSGKSTYFNNQLLDDFKEIKPILLKNNLKIKDLIVEPDNLRRVLFGTVNYGFSCEPFLWKQIIPYSLNYKLRTYGVALLDSTFLSKRNKFLKEIDYDELVYLVFKNEPFKSFSRVYSDIKLGKDRSRVPYFVFMKMNETYIKSVIGEQDVLKHLVWNENTEEKIIHNLKKENFNQIKIIK